MTQIIYAAIYLVVTIAAFFLGKYVTPTLLTSEVVKNISAWAYKFVVCAKNLYEDGEGEKKRDYVTELLQDICKKNHISLTDEQIRALIEEAYMQMKAGESEAPKE